MQVNFLGCPFCNSQPFIEDGKRGSCQLHGEPFQPIIIRCKKHECHAKPSISWGDIYNGGRLKAIQEAAQKWNKRPIEIEEYSKSFGGKYAQEINN